MFGHLIDDFMDSFGLTQEVSISCEDRTLSSKDLCTTLILADTVDLEVFEDLGYPTLSMFYVLKSSTDGTQFCFLPKIFF
jgi:hypothetical protein